MEQGFLFFVESLEARWFRRFAGLVSGDLGPARGLELLLLRVPRPPGHGRREDQQRRQVPPWRETSPRHGRAGLLPDLRRETLPDAPHQRLRSLHPA